MNKIVKYFLIFWLIGLVIAAIVYLFKPENRSVLVGVVLTVIGVSFLVLKEKFRRKKEGYYVYTRGGGEDGIVVYDETGKTLNLYFNRREDTIYVPSNAKWKELMPDWAKEKKAVIMHRIKQRIGNRMIGKNWAYEETDKQDYLIDQDSRGSAPVK